jgi:hypothetical protein
MTSQIERGDVVRLKSGGAPMTVEFITPAGVMGFSAHVVWMTAKAERMSAMIMTEALEKMPR